MSNDYRAYVECNYNSIYHSGIKGMKWGIRRYQNEDGTLTEAGKKRYGKLYAAYRSRGATKKQAADAIRGYHKSAGAIDLMNAGTAYARARLNDFTRGQAAALAALNYGGSKIARRLLDKHVAPKLITDTGLGDITETSFKNQRKQKKKKSQTPKHKSNGISESYKSELKSRYDKVKKENPKWIKDNFGNDSFKSIMNNDPDLLYLALEEYDDEKKSKRRSR